MPVITLPEVITWLIVGALAGWLAGMLVMRRRQGFGYVKNLGVGLAGALIGGLLFKLLHINLGILSEITVSLQEVIAGFFGALVFLVILAIVQYWLARRRRA